MVSVAESNRPDIQTTDALRVWPRRHGASQADQMASSSLAISCPVCEKQAPGRAPKP